MTVLITPAPKTPGAVVKLMLMGKTHGTVHLVGNLRTLSGSFPCSGLGHGPGCRFPGRTEGLKPRISGAEGGRNLPREHRQLLLHRLELGDFPAKLLALKGVGNA